MSVSSIHAKTNETSLQPRNPNWPPTISGQIVINGEVTPAEVLVPSLFRAIYVLQNELHNTQKHLKDSRNQTRNSKAEVRKVKLQLERVHEEKQVALGALKIRTDELRSAGGDLARAKLRQRSLQKQLTTLSKEVQETSQELDQLAKDCRHKTLLLKMKFESGLK